MKFLVAVLSMALANAALPVFGTPTKTRRLSKGDISADSPLGQKMLANARRLEQDDEVDFTWVSDFSIKWQGCHHISQWNEEANGEEDVRIQTKRLARFRLCPSKTCSLENAGGCDSGYGDYIIDLNMYLELYFEAVEEYNEWRCEYMEEMVCGCNDENNNNGDDFDEEICLYDCLAENGMVDICDIDNPYEDDEAQDEEEFEAREFIECANFDFPDQNGRRRLNQEIEYFIGPYCAEQGGSVYLGLFTDETCTTFADDYGGTQVYSQGTGKSLPYSASNLVEIDCFSCHELEEIDADGNNNNNNNDNDEDLVKEMCEQLYMTAGKCESQLSIDDPNENACNYMEGIKIVRNDGIVTQAAATANKGASIFIGVFVVAFVLLAAYVYYLKTKLDRASINLSE